LHKEEKKFPKEKGTFLGEQFTFFREGPKLFEEKGNFPKKTMYFPQGKAEVTRGTIMFRIVL